MTVTFISIQVNLSVSIERSTNSSTTAGNATGYLFLASSGSGEEFIDDESYQVDAADAHDLLGISGEEAKMNDFLVEEALLAKIAEENHSTLFKLGPQYEDFVFECSFRGYDCR